MIPKNYENHMYTTIPPEYTPYENLEEYFLYHYDNQDINFEDIIDIQFIVDEEDYLNFLINDEPKR